MFTNAQLRPAMMRLATRATQGDPDVPVIMLGYDSANPGHTEELAALFDECLKEVSNKRNTMGAPAS